MNLEATYWLNYLLMVTAWLAVIFMAKFMWVYVRVVMPLKGKIAAGELISPPMGWLLAYHGTFAWVLFWLSVSTLIRTQNGEHLPWPASLLAAGCLAVALIAGKFSRKYAALLDDY